MKYLMLFADTFEDTEAIATLDVLLRGGDNVDPVSMMGRKAIQTKCGNVLNIEYTLGDVDVSSYDALIIPGGPASFKLLAFMPQVDSLIKEFVESNRVVCAICAAPFLIGRLGYLKDKKYTVHPGFEDKIIGGIYLRDQGVVEDGNFITAKAMYYSCEFGLKILSHFHGQEYADKIRRNCQGEF